MTEYGNLRRLADRELQYDEGPHEDCHFCTLARALLAALDWIEDQLSEHGAIRGESPYHRLAALNAEAGKVLDG